MAEGVTGANSRNVGPRVRGERKGLSFLASALWLANEHNDNGQATLTKVEEWRRTRILRAPSHTSLLRHTIMTISSIIKMCDLRPRSFWRPHCTYNAFQGEPQMSTSDIASGACHYKHCFYPSNSILHSDHSSLSILEQIWKRQNTRMIHNLTGQNNQAAAHSKRNK